MGAEKDSLEPGSHFQDRYLLAGELGIGSFGRVYRVRQLSTGRDLALKVLRVRDCDTPPDVENHRSRFRREMRLCAELSHPHRLLDSDETADGFLFAVFELEDSRIRSLK